MARVTVIRNFPIHFKAIYFIYKIIFNQISLPETENISSNLPTNFSPQFLFESKKGGVKINSKRKLPLIFIIFISRCKRTRNLYNCKIQSSIFFKLPTYNQQSAVCNNGNITRILYNKSLLFVDLKVFDL